MKIDLKKTPLEISKEFVRQWVYDMQDMAIPTDDLIRELSRLINCLQAGLPEAHVLGKRIPPEDFKI